MIFKKWRNRASILATAIVASAAFVYSASANAEECFDLTQPTWHHDDYRACTLEVSDGWCSTVYRREYDKQNYNVDSIHCQNTETGVSTSCKQKGFWRDKFTCEYRDADGDKISPNQILQ